MTDAILPADCVDDLHDPRLKRLHDYWRDRCAGTAMPARAVIDPDNVEAEFAIIVRSDEKGRGLGHVLIRTLIEFLESRGTQRLIALVLRENLPMRTLALSNGFVLDEARSDSDALCFVLTLSHRAR